MLFHPEIHAFLPIAATPALHHNFTKALLCSALYSIHFSTTVWVMIFGTVVCTLCKTWASVVLAGELLALFFAWNVSQTFKELKAKGSIVKYHGKATHPAQNDFE